MTMEQWALLRYVQFQEVKVYSCLNFYNKATKQAGVQHMPLKQILDVRMFNVGQVIFLASNDLPQWSVDYCCENRLMI